MQRSKLKLAHGFVMELLGGNQIKGNYVGMDNFFTSIGLFEELVMELLELDHKMQSSRFAARIQRSQGFQQKPTMYVSVENA